MGRKGQKKKAPINFRMPTIREEDVPEKNRTRSLWRAAQQWHINAITIGPSDFIKPNRCNQTPWTYYQRLLKDRPGHIEQAWLNVPFLVSAPTSGPHASFDLTRATGGVMFADIHQMKAKAQGHPWVIAVGEHKEDKNVNMESTFDAIGRCTHGHQSPFDIKVTTTVFGDIYMGWTVNHCAQYQGQIWWSWGKDQWQTDEHRSNVYKFLLDIAGILHPDERVPTLAELWVDPDDAGAASSSGASDSRGASGTPGPPQAWPRRQSFLEAIK